MAGAAGPGAFLRERRAAKGLSVAEVSSATRIAPRFLDALEQDRLEALPAPVFVRGFIRAYCTVVEAAADAALELYEANRPAVPIPVTAPPRSTATPGSPRVAAVSRPPAAPAATARRGSSRPSVMRPVVRPVFVVGAVAIGLACVVAYWFVTSGESPRPAAPAVQPDPPVAAPSDSPTPVPAAPTRSETVPAGGRVLVLRAHEPTWVRVRPDDALASQELLQAGAVREWRSPGRFTVTVGNAGGVVLELDGVPLPSLGKPGEVVRDRTIPGGAPS